MKDYLLQIELAWKATLNRKNTTLSLKNDFGFLLMR